MYERQLESILTRSAVNTVNDGTSTGLIFSHPFGSLQTMGPGPIKGGTLKRIKGRGHHKCGMVLGFAKFDPVAGVWNGFDINFCKAVAAAISNGVTSNVIYTDLSATERFTALANGDVDVLSRITTWNVERDVLEPTSGEGFDFSQVNFYDGIAVAGKPQ